MDTTEFPGQYMVKTTCPHCMQVTSVTVDREGYDRWKAGELIQRALPNLSADEREMLMTGICPNCWDKIFPPDDDE
jgi:hypothetical protein